MPPDADSTWANIAIVVVILGILTIGGCAYRGLNRPNSIHFNIGG